jgi:hypothetical protein
MTGVEAISNGIPIFRKPETRNAALTLTWMAAILGTLFPGITLLAMTYGVEASPSGNPTVIAKIAQHVFSGPLIFLFPLFQLSVLGILVLSAETSFAGFPRLAYLLARDGYLPKQFSLRGDRLAFSVGIIALAVMASLLLIIFGGNTNALINLFVVGVFVAFTLSQSGMVVLIPLLVLLFTRISHHYQYVARERVTSLPLHPKDIRHRLLVPIARLDEASQLAMAYARSIAPQVTAVHVAVNREKADALRTAWDEWQTSLPAQERSALDIIDPGHRLPLLPLLDYINAVHRQYPLETLTVVLPEAVESSLRRVFYSPKILGLKVTLLFRPGTVVADVPLAGLDRATLASLAYARSISGHVIAMHVVLDDEQVEQVRASWQQWQHQLPAEEETHLVIIESPYRSLLRPILAYVDAVQQRHPEDILTVIVPEFVVVHWWEYDVCAICESSPSYKGTTWFLGTDWRAKIPVIGGSLRERNMRKTDVQQLNTGLPRLQSKTPGEGSECVEGPSKAFRLTSVQRFQRHERIRLLVLGMDCSLCSHLSGQAAICLLRARCRRRPGPIYDPGF